MIRQCLHYPHGPERVHEYGQPIDVMDSSLDRCQQTIRAALVATPERVAQARERLNVDSDNLHRSLSPEERQAAQHPGMSQEQVMSTEIKPGSATSEFKLSAFVAVVGTILQVAGVALEALRDSGVSAPWVSIALLVVGTLLQIATALGYQKSRTAVKTAALSLPKS